MRGHSACGRLLALSVLVGGVPAPPAPAAGRPPAQEPVPPARLRPRLASPREQLADATALRMGLRGTRGHARSRALDRALWAYQSVHAHWPREREVRAEAAFRSGELLRAAHREGGALEAFALTRRMDPVPASASPAGVSDRGVARGTWGARALLEIGHVHRRAGRSEEALDAYLELVAAAGAVRGVRDSAALWAGRVHAREERLEDARRLWRRLAEDAEDAVDRIAAYDALALAHVAEGDLEAAAGMLERCRAACADLIAEATTRGERVRRSLARMRAVGAIERGVERRRRGVVVGGGEPPERSRK